MVGYNHDFSNFDALVPYGIRCTGTDNEGFGREYLEIFHKETGHNIYSYKRNYRSYGTSAWYPFKYEDKWYSFISPSYTSFKVLEMDTGNIVAELKNNSNFCPINFYVPAWYPEDNIVYKDYEFSDKDDFEDDFIFDIGKLNYLHTGFVCGVWWGADYEWLVYKIDIPTLLKTGEYHMDSEHYCFDFDYNTMPEIRQFIKTDEMDSDDNGSYARFYYYTQKFVDMQYPPYDKWT